MGETLRVSLLEQVRQLLRLGVQVSIAGKIYQSVERAQRLNCNTMQIFARNPRRFRRGSLSDKDIETFKERVKKAKLKPVAIHIPYTLNLASARPNFHYITIREFTADLREADRLGAEYIITHMGSHKDSSEEDGLAKVALALTKILKATEGGKTVVLLENTSGSGRWLGDKFAHHRFILEKLDWTPRVGICLDTAHAWAAGYKINSSQGVDDIVKEIDKEVGLSRLKIIHLNDTKEELGSLRDRHFPIGEGSIGKKGFSAIINHPKLRKIPFILETPKKTEDDDTKNLNVVRGLDKD